MRGAISAIARRTRPGTVQRMIAACNERRGKGEWVVAGRRIGRVVGPRAGGDMVVDRNHQGSRIASSKPRITPVKR